MSQRTTVYPEINSLRAFVLTAQEGSTAAAAKHLGVSQPAVSSAIHRLEEIVGTELFDRSSRPMQLTVAGRVLKNRVEGLVLELDTVCSGLANIINFQKLDVRVGFSDSISGCVSAFLLPRILNNVNNLQVYGQSTPILLDRFLNNQIDIAICTKFPSENPDVVAFPLLFENFIVVTPKAYAEKIHSIHDLSILPKTLPIIRYNDISLDSVQIERVLRQCNIKGGRVIAADTNASVLGIVNAGMGWSVMTPLSIWMAKEYMDNVAFQEINSLKASRTFYVMYKNSLHSSFATLIFKEAKKVIQGEIIPKLNKHSTFLGKSIELANLT